MVAGLSSQSICLALYGGRCYFANDKKVTSGFWSKSHFAFVKKIAPEPFTLVRKKSF
jgi:hypothetical protein